MHYHFATPKIPTSLVSTRKLSHKGMPIYYSFLCLKIVVLKQKIQSLTNVKLLHFLINQISYTPTKLFFLIDCNKKKTIILKHFNIEKKTIILKRKEHKISKKTIKQIHCVDIQSLLVQDLKKEDKKLTFG